jgi:hypothetical protein
LMSQQLLMKSSAVHMVLVYHLLLEHRNGQEVYRENVEEDGVRGIE